ncbi:hypothetical protein ACQQ2N_12300 [Dokdonella sp. MW10]|uniref:hypothetical protein n=1 Tax=Dokdonella sp. MW10 TaxID=2992926 RepID=UPI003F7E2FBA
MIGRQCTTQRRPASHGAASYSKLAVHRRRVDTAGCACIARHAVALEDLERDLRRPANYADVMDHMSVSYATAFRILARGRKLPCVCRARYLEDFASIELDLGRLPTYAEVMDRMLVCRATAFRILRRAKGLSR